MAHKQRADTDLRTRLKALGYTLETGALMATGWPKAFCTRPNDGSSSGVVNYFDTLGQVERYCAEVEEVRRWQEDAPFRLQEAGAEEE